MSLLVTRSSIFSIALVATSLLLLGVFLPHSGEFTRFLHRIGFAYLIFHLFRRGNREGIVLRFDDVKVRSQRGSDRVNQRDYLYGRFFYLVSTGIVAIFFYGIAERFFLSKRGEREFPLLILFLHLGGLFVLRLSTFRDLLLALERVTLASYVLVTFERQSRFSTYAGIQYFLLGSIPSGRLLLGFALFYLQGGSLVLQDLDLLFFVDSLTAVFTLEVPRDFIWRVTNESVSSVSRTENTSLPSFDGVHSYRKRTNNRITSLRQDSPSCGWLTSLRGSVSPVTGITRRGLFLLCFNLFFKLTAAPFHFWAPSVYGKAPLPSVTFLSIYSKARVLFFLYKLLRTIFHSFSFLTAPYFLLCGIRSVLVGRTGAFTETVTKRFFVYSSRGHVGFRLVGLSLGTLEGSRATFHYLLVYIRSSFRRWFLLLTRGSRKHHLSHFSELKKNEPVLGLRVALLFFSRSGIPPLGGFFIKLDVLAALLDTGHIFTNYVLFFCTVASFFYYLRVRKILFFDETTKENSKEASKEKDLLRFGYEGRLWLRSLAFLILGFYRFVVQPPLLGILGDLLSALFLFLFLI